MSFADICAAYIAERRAAGCRMDKEERALARLAALHAGMGCPGDALPRALVEAWCAGRPGEAEATRLGRASVARCLASWMARMGCDAWVAPAGTGRTGEGAYQPHIFSDRELAALFAAADALAGGDAASPRAQKALILRMLYSSGLRCGEACALGKADVDLEAGILTLHQAKNGRDRLVPVHPAIAERMRAFSDAAWAAHPQYPSHGLFWSLPEGAPITTDGVYRLFRQALWDAGISHGGRGKGPRVHDLRHTFACHRIRGWARGGEDINARLPILAAYMGHASTKCTEYYLRLTAELFPDIAARAEEAGGWVVPSWE